MSSALIPCTVQVLTRNNAAGLKPCLDSLTDFGEVIVQDGYSTDGSREIASSYPNVRLMDQNRAYLDEKNRITDFASMRNDSIRAAKFEWIFIVDGDEEVQRALIEEVREIVAKDEPGAFEAFRRFYIAGKRIDWSSSYPALQIRLIHRSCTDGYVKKIHERFRLHPGVKTTLLKTELTLPLPSLEELLPKYQRYLDMEVMRQGVLPWSTWIKWVLLRNIRSIAALTLRLLRIWLIPRKGNRMPLSYELVYMRHSWRIILRTFPPAARAYLHQLKASHTSAI